MRKCRIYLFFVCLLSLLYLNCENPTMENLLEPLVRSKTYFTVTFDSMGGSDVPNQSVNSHNKANKPDDPFLLDYNFVAWFKDEDYLERWDFAIEIVTEDITLYAGWSLGEYYIFFSGNNETGGEPPEELIVDIGFSTTIPGNVGSFYRVGYTFSGWNTLANGSGDNYTSGDIFLPTSSGTLYARWIPITYTVIFDANGASGTAMPNETHTYDVISAMPDIEYTGATGLNYKTWNTQTDGLGTRYEAGQLVMNLRNTPGTFIVYAVFSDRPVPYVFWPTNLTAVYGQTLSNIAPTGNGNPATPGVFEWVTSTNAVGNVGVQYHTMRFNPYDTDQFGSATNEVPVNVTPQPISSAQIIVTSPATGFAPNPIASSSVSGNYSINGGQVVWTPNDSTFKPGTQYTATVTLTRMTENYTFTGGLSTATINGYNATVTNNTGTSVTLSVTFPATSSNYTIAPWPTASPITYGQQLSDSALNGGVSSIPGTFMWTTGNEIPGAGIITRQVTFIPTDSSFANRTEIITINVNRRTLTITEARTTKAYDGGIAISGGINIELGGILASDTGSLNYGTVTAEYTALLIGTNTVRITDVQLTGTSAPNYNVTVPLTIILTGAPSGITKAVGAAVVEGTGLRINTLNSDQFTITPIAAPANGQSVEYGLGSNTDTVPATNWQQSTTFNTSQISGGAGSPFRIFARSREDESHNAGAIIFTSGNIFYTVTFNSAGGNYTPSTQYIISGGTATLPPPPTYTGFTFDGWNIAAVPYVFGSTVSANITLIAQWIANQTFNLDFTQIQNPLPLLNNVTIHRLAANGQTTVSLNLTNPGQYESINWSYNGMVLSSLSSIILTSEDNRYNSIGPKIFTLKVTVLEAGVLVPYTRDFTVTVAY